MAISLSQQALLKHQITDANREHHFLGIVKVNSGGPKTPSNLRRKSIQGPNSTITHIMTSPTHNAYLPVWISDTNIDPVWIEQVTGLKDVSKCVVEDISNQGRRREAIKDGTTLKLVVSFQDASKELGLVIKQVPLAGQDHSKMLGLSREALFYLHLAPRLVDGKVIPKVHHSFGDMATGAKLILMEDLSADYLDSGILFGPGNPNNWTRDLRLLTAKAYPNIADKPPSSQQVAHQTFLAVAKIHATFWKDKSLLSHSYLRCADWIQGQDKKSWEASQQYIQGIWDELKRNHQLDTVIQWDPVVLACVTKAMEGISWEAQLKRIHVSGGHWTLVHGDFWPGNILISTNCGHEEGNLYDLKLLDWEMVGIGSGPQDLGQYILSNMDPLERRMCEQSLIATYHSELIRLGVKDFSWEECWREYKIGGVERWLWFLVYFVGQEGALLKWAQFFHDQIASFVADHRITPDDLVQPRP